MPATIPPAQVGTVAPYPRGVLPILPAGEGVFIQRELDRIRTALADMMLMLPQTATKAPAPLKDGMLRLSRAPWRPVVGQVDDQWVYWDAAGQLWRHIGVSPTTT